jgi:hypothetical protein
MEALNLPTYFFNIKSEGEDKYIFDGIRKKFVRLTSEEWVRQNFIRYLADEKSFPQGLIGVEISIRLNQLSKRCDILAYNRAGTPLLVTECKASSVKINQEVFDQVVRYNMVLNVHYLIVTNGLQHYCCRLFPETGRVQYLKEVPDYKDIA